VPKIKSQLSLATVDLGQNLVAAGLYLLFAISFPVRRFLIERQIANSK